MQETKDYIYNNVKLYMEKKRIYLDPTLNLAKFSQIVGTNTTYLSNVVNLRFGCNFKTMVNRYRVLYAKEALQNGEVALADLPGHCGFASRSTFYEVFRKQEGITPMQYIQLREGARRHQSEKLTGEYSASKDYKRDKTVSDKKKNNMFF